MKSLTVGLAGFPSAGSLFSGFFRSSFGVLLVTAETKLGSWARIKAYAVGFIGVGTPVGWMEGPLMHLKLVPWSVH